MVDLKTFIKAPPQEVLSLSFDDSIGLLKEITSPIEFEKAFTDKTFYPSPVKDDEKWHKTVKIIGINPKLTKTFWGVVKYAMTFPEEGVHLMPLFETGADESLYIQNSWKLNKDFLDDDLYNSGFLTPESQLKVVINVLHLLGKYVGFDAMLHTDAFSKIVFCNPSYFEWAKLNEYKTAQLFSPEINYNTIFKEVEKIIITASNAPDNLFELPENERMNILFSKDGEKNRLKLMDEIRKRGYEPLPVTEHMPRRPIVFDRLEGDKKNNRAVFKVENQSQKAKIIGCAAGYKLYGIDEEGYIKQNETEKDCWDYLIGKFADFQKEFNFDFLRADMAHNQMSHSHKGPVYDNFNQNEIWRRIKEKIKENSPHFKTLAESFYSDYYINGMQDMENKDFDLVLGDFNYMYLNSDAVNLIKKYLTTEERNLKFTPCICAFSNDSDLPENNKYYKSFQANEIRMFLSLFLKLPSYMGMGFEVRDLVPLCESNYSNYYVKRQKDSYRFGINKKFFESLSEMRNIYRTLKDYLEKNSQILESTFDNEQLAWKTGEYFFCVNLNPNKTEIKTNCVQKSSKIIYTNFQYEDITIVEGLIKDIYIGESLILKL